MGWSLLAVLWHSFPPAAPCLPLVPSPTTLSEALSVPHCECSSGFYGAILLRLALNFKLGIDSVSNLPSWPRTAHLG